MDRLFEHYFDMLNLSSSEEIVDTYSRILDSMFQDGVYNNGRYFVAREFAVYISNRVSHEGLLQRLCAVLERKRPVACVVL